MKELPGRWLGAFLLVAMGVLIGVHFLGIELFHGRLVGIYNIILLTGLLGITSLFLMPKEITLGDFLKSAKNKQGFLKKVWRYSGTFTKGIWVLILCVAVLQILIWGV